MEKIIFIDVDGTLTTGLSSWERVHHHFEKSRPGMVEKMDANTELWKSGEIDYNTWAKMDVALWKGLPYTELENALLPPLLMEGAREGIKKLKENNFHVVLVSGGLNVMVDEVKNIVGADEAYSNRVLETNGIINGDVSVPVGNTKVEVVEKLVKKYNISWENTYAIGDHINDMEMFDYCNYSLGVNIKRENLREHATDVIKSDNFEDTVSFLLDNSNNKSINGK